MKTEADTGGIQPQAKGRLGPPGAEEAGRTLPRAFGDHGASTSDLSNWQRRRFCCFKPPSLRPFLIAAFGT